MLVAVAEMVLAELTGRVAERLEQLGDRRILGLQAQRGARHSDLREPGAERVLAGDERGAPGGAALLTVVVREVDRPRSRCGRCSACGSPSFRGCSR